VHIDRFPRLRLAHLPTPLESMPALSRALGGPDLWIKRDDCTGLATGGNKTRKLEFLMAEAIEARADTVLTPGAVQSNHARQTAAAAAKLGMHCEILLEEARADGDEDYAGSGNILIDRVCNARIRRYPKDTDLVAEMAALAKSLREAGKRPYVIPAGGSNAVGALGYANCAAELLSQSRASGRDIDLVIHASGSAGTQAGLIAGFHALEANVPVLGICVGRAADAQEEMVRSLAEETLALLGTTAALPRERVQANGDYVGEGYGIPTAGMVEAVELVARSEGILLDPVYSGKAMAGLIDLLRTDRLEHYRNVVFLHTGGTVALFAYRSTFDHGGG
jgi:L-cysteate sulfo-lyase